MAPKQLYHLIILPPSKRARRTNKNKNKCSTKQKKKHSSQCEVVVSFFFTFVLYTYHTKMYQTRLHDRQQQTECVVDAINSFRITAQRATHFLVGECVWMWMCECECVCVCKWLNKWLQLSHTNTLIPSPSVIHSCCLSPSSHLPPPSVCFSLLKFQWHPPKLYSVNKIPVRYLQTTRA